MLDKEKRLFASKQDEWSDLYPNQFVLVKAKELIATFDSIEDALQEGYRLYGRTSFLIRHVDEQDEEMHIPALTLGLLQS